MNQVITEYMKNGLAGVMTGIRIMEADGYYRVRVTNEEDGFHLGGEYQVNVVDNEVQFIDECNWNQADVESQDPKIIEEWLNSEWL